MAKGYSARNGFGGSAGMMRQQQQMQQKLARMQQDMEAAQKNVEESSFTASVGGGAVQATVSGKKQVTALTIQPDAVDPADVEMLQDLILSAVNEALRQAEDAVLVDSTEMTPEQVVDEIVDIVERVYGKRA